MTETGRLAWIKKSHSTWISDVDVNVDEDAAEGITHGNTPRRSRRASLVYDTSPRAISTDRGPITERLEIGDWR
jgi:hypothetical protein